MGFNRERILYEDDHLLAVNKLAGELTVRGAGEMQKKPLFDFLKKDYSELRVIHRLDFETSGVLFFARTKEAYEAIRATHFAGWKKVYRAIVAHRMRQQHGDIRIALPSRKSEIRREQPETVPALTHFEVIQKFPDATYVQCIIDTGRHHQIRRHFAGIHHPLALDEVYGEAKFNRAFGRFTGFRRFFLHALSVDLPHPMTGKQLHVEAPLPRLFQEVLKKLS